LRSISAKENIWRSQKQAYIFLREIFLIITIFFGVIAFANLSYPHIFEGAFRGDSITEMIIRFIFIDFSLIFFVMGVVLVIGIQYILSKIKIKGNLISITYNSSGGKTEKIIDEIKNCYKGNLEELDKSTYSSIYSVFSAYSVPIKRIDIIFRHLGMGEKYIENPFKGIVIMGVTDSNLYDVEELQNRIDALL
jgi:hypothetical protein